jgi:hypothetical protein
LFSSQLWRQAQAFIDSGATVASSVNLTTANVGNVTVGSGGKYQVPRSVPRPLVGNPTLVVIVIVAVQSFTPGTMRIIPRFRVQ